MLQNPKPSFIMERNFPMFITFPRRTSSISVIATLAFLRGSFLIHQGFFL